jgi:hypothetical protein
MNADELRERIEAKHDVSGGDVRQLLDSPQPEERVLARLAVAQTSIRQALQYCCDLAREQGYADQSTLTAVQRLATISDVDRPYIETLKQLGLQAASHGNVDGAMQLMQDAVSRAVASGQRSDARSKRCMRYMHDLDMGAAIEALSKRFEAPQVARAAIEPLRLLLICSAMQDEDAPSLVTLKRAEYFCDEGFNVTVMSTEMVNSAGSRMTKRLQELGVPFEAAVGGTFSQRLLWMLARATAHQANIACYEASAVDYLAQLAASVGVAPVQAWDNKGTEPVAGSYDLVSQGMSPEQESHTRWPGKARYHGPYIALADEIDAAGPLDRATLGLPNDAVVLATFGRMEKCATPAYLEPMALILAAEPAAWLLLAGRNAFGAIEKIMRYFEERGVAPRVRYLGPRQNDGPSLLKSVDVYCDTHPWAGGQSVADAMQAGLPIVAMRRANDSDFDPTGYAATGSVADILLDGLVEMAPAGDGDAYVRIARSLIRDACLRAETGRRIRRKAVADCSMRAATARFARDLREIVAAKAAAAK